MPISHPFLMPISHPFLTRLSSISHQFKPIHFHITSWPHNLASSLLKSSQSISSPSIAVLNHKKNTSSEHVVYNFFLFCHSKQYLYTTCSELVFFGDFNEQSLVILWVNWFKNKSFWRRFICTRIQLRCTQAKNHYSENQASWNPVTRGLGINTLLLRKSLLNLKLYSQYNHTVKEWSVQRGRKGIFD